MIGSNCSSLGSCHAAAQFLYVFQRLLYALALALLGVAKLGEGGPGWLVGVWGLAWGSQKGQGPAWLVQGPWLGELNTWGHVVFNHELMIQET